MTMMMVMIAQIKVSHLTQNTNKARKNKDHVIDNNGRKLLALCKSTDHIIANGRLCNDPTGNYTFISERGLSVTDYLLLNKSDIHLVHDFKILDFNNFSDHAPVCFILLKKCTSTKKLNVTTKNGQFEQKIIFDEEKITEFRELLTQNLNSINICTNQETVENQ